jgi:hypothetical protein
MVANERTIKKTIIEDFIISTTFIGMGARPFETLVTGSWITWYSIRSETEILALYQHKKELIKVTKMVKK